MGVEEAGVDQPGADDRDRAVCVSLDRLERDAEERVDDHLVLVACPVDLGHDQVAGEVELTLLGQRARAARLVAADRAQVGLALRADPQPAHVTRRRRHELEAVGEIRREQEDRGRVRAPAASAAELDVSAGEALVGRDRPAHSSKSVRRSAVVFWIRFPSTASSRSVCWKASLACSRAKRGSSSKRRL